MDNQKCPICVGRQLQCTCTLRFTYTAVASFASRRTEIVICGGSNIVTDPLFDKLLQVGYRIL